MRLASTDGASFSLKIDGYQFPGSRGFGRQDWDANWLVIAGAVDDGISEWTFRDPSLTTWDASEIADWLDSVVDGSTKANSIATDEPDGLLAFTEPNLAFNLQRREGEICVIRVYFSLEAAPRPLDGVERTGIYEYFVDFSLPINDLGQSANEWRAEIRRFPAR